MPETLENALPYITGALFGLALLLFLLSVRLFRRSRTDVFWRRRREAGQRGWRLFVLAFTLLIFSGAACGMTVLTGLLADDEETSTASTPIAEQNPIPSPAQTQAVFPADTPAPPATTEPVATLGANTATPTSSPENTRVVVVVATPTHTPTETPFPTFTPEVAPLASSVTPQPDAQIVITALDDQISDTLTPVNPRNVFATGTERIYLFVEFRGMAQGVLWQRQLWRDGEQVDGNAYLWGLEDEGTGYFFFGNDSGFEPGQYEIRLFIGNSDMPINTMTFTISESP